VEHKLNKRLLLAIVDILEVLELLIKDLNNLPNFTNNNKLNAKLGAYL
jgi:hypothetical protein